MSSYMLYIMPIKKQDDKVIFQHSIFLKDVKNITNANDFMNNMIMNMLSQMVPQKGIYKMIWSLYNVLMANNVKITDEEYDRLIEKIIIDVIKEAVRNGNQYASKISTIDIATDGENVNITINENESYIIKNRDCDGEDIYIVEDADNVDVTFDMDTNHLLLLLEHSYNIANEGYDEVTDRIGIINTLFTLYNIMYCLYNNGDSDD